VAGRLGTAGMTESHRGGSRGRPRRLVTADLKRGRLYWPEVNRDAELFVGASKAKRLLAMKKAHFSRDLFGFLEELRCNNRREWFEANRVRYERDVREPMLAFIADFAPRLRKISPQLIADPRPSGGSMFRIHRDLRFSPDKRPYKTHVAARFSHVMGRDVHAPGFYGHLEPSGVVSAAGI